MNDKEAKKVVVIKPSSYQPSVMELKQDLRLDVPFETALGMLVKSVDVKVEGSEKLEGDGE